MRQGVPVFKSLQADFGDRVDFVVVYIVEAHTRDEWPMPLGEGMLCAYDQPKTLEERAQRAAEYVERFDLGDFRVYLDSMDNTFNNTFMSWPERWFVIDSDIVSYIDQPDADGHNPEDLRVYLTTFFEKQVDPETPKPGQLACVFPGEDAILEPPVMTSPGASGVEFEPTILDGKDT